MTQGKDNNKPRIPDSVDMERLKKMEDGCQDESVRRSKRNGFCRWLL